MVSYYDIVEGNLRTGDIAKSTDIIHIQNHIQDALKNLLSDLHDNESYILGSGEEHKNDFILTAAPKLLGRYVDYYFTFNIDEEKYIDINHHTVKQPIVLTKTSLYSVITRLKNSSNRDITLDFELQDEDGFPLRKNSITIPKNSREYECEIVFDLDYYPTIHNVNFDDIINNDSVDIPLITKEKGYGAEYKSDEYDTGYQNEHDNEVDSLEASTGASILYFVIKQANLNAIDLYDNDEEPLNFDAYTSLGAYYSESSPAANKDIYLKQGRGNDFEKVERNLWIKAIYANEPTYLCTGGTAVINGEKVLCRPTHVSVAGGNDYGNVLSTIYLDIDGRLNSNNSKASTTTDITKFEEDLDDPNPMDRLIIAEILTYSTTLGYEKEPLVIQNQFLSHHERIRRLENRLDWTMDKALPSRIKYTLDSESWLSEDDGLLTYTYPFAKPSNEAELKEKLEHKTISFDSQGNPIIRITNAIVQNVTATLKEEITEESSNNQVISDNSSGVSILSSKKNMVHDSKKGILTLDTEKKKDKTANKSYGLTAKEAKETKYNPWDDYKGNRPKTSDIKVTSREYVVHSGKNKEEDKSSSFPAMTFYTNKRIKLKKLEIPIRKFKNCSGMKFFIYRRQKVNNKKNIVPSVEKPAIWHSKELSLKKAKTKGKYQYLDSGFTLNFKDGLSLSKGQYIILCLPVPKGDKGSCFVETFKPQNPKDFCIRYVGNSNASYFRFNDRYPEIWYNPASATIADEEDYAKNGEVISSTITWTDSSLPAIKTIKPVVADNLTYDKNTSAKLYVDTGGGFQEVKIGEENTVTGSNQSFRWKLEFFGNGKGTPKLAYDKKDGFALQFIVTREAVGFNNEDEFAKYNKSICLTSKIFDGDDILRQYVGDPNLGRVDSKVSQFEFGRIWAEKEANKNMIIDIQGADRTLTFDGLPEVAVPFWSYHYCDLSLDDFSDTNVDYNDYTQDLEYDENNLRFKIDPNHSYNDNDISILKLDDFKKYPNDIDDSESKEMVFRTNTDIKQNQLFMKNLLPNNQTIDLTKYTGLRFNFKVRSSSSKASLKGVAIYISSNEEKPIFNGENNVPSAIRNDPEKLNVLTDEKALIPEISDDTQYYKFYEGNMIKISHLLEGDKAESYEYYQYVPSYNSLTGEITYKLQKYHDFRTYKIYYLPDIVYDESDTGSLQTKDSDKWVNFSARIEIDQNSQNLKNVREIGIISIHDEEKKAMEVVSLGTTTTESNSESTTSNSESTTSNSESTENNSESTTSDSESTESDSKTSEGVTNIRLELDKVRAISEDYYPIFNPETQTFVKEKHTTVYKSGALPFKEGTKAEWQENYGTENIPNSGNGIVLKETTPKTNMISIDYKEIDSDTETLLCYFNNEYDLTNYKHVGVQIASDIYIPKDCFKICFCAEPEGQKEIASINIPTLNGVYLPLDSKNAINLNQLMKKINKETSIKSISIKATKKCADLLSKTGGLLDTDKKSKVNLFIGKIVLYKAETIPMFHNKMRYKIYSMDDDGSIIRYVDNIEAGREKAKIAIRKLGVVCEYK